MFVFFPVLHGPNKTRVGEGEMSEGERRGREERCDSGGGELKQHLMEIPTAAAAGAGEGERDR